MTRPGDRLRRLVMRCCSERTRRRLIDPAVADLQAEVAAAHRSHSAWRTLRALAAGYLSIAKVLLIATAGELQDCASTWQPEERAGARRGLLVALAATALATGLLVGIPAHGATETMDRVLLSLYLTPSMLPVTLQLGLLLGTAWTFHGAARTRKLGVAAMALAALCSIGMFVNLGWLTPEANQAFRELTIPPQFRDGTDRPLARGFNELTLPAMRRRLQEARLTESPSQVRYYEAAYHQKLALSIAPLPLVGVILALAFRRRWRRGSLTAAAVALFAAHLLILMSIQLYGPRLGASPLLIGWAATALAAAAAVVITSTRGRRPA